MAHAYFLRLYPSHLDDRMARISKVHQGPLNPVPARFSPHGTPPASARKDRLFSNEQETSDQTGRVARPSFLFFFSRPGRLKEIKCRGAHFLLGPIPLPNLGVVGATPAGCTLNLNTTVIPAGSNPPIENPACRTGQMGPRQLRDNNAAG